MNRAKLNGAPRALLLGLVIIAANSFLLIGAATSAGSSRFNAAYFMDATVVDQTGKSYRFFDDLIRGKSVVINFVYLNCTDLCPLTTSRIAELKDQLGAVVGDKVHLYTITMDPDQDRPENLKAYANAFDAGNGWRFLTGDPETIKTLRWRLGERSRILSEHRNDIVLGNDVTGEWSRISAYSDIEILRRSVRELAGLEPDNATVRSAANRLDTPHSKAVERYRLDKVVGEALFVKACSTCHSIGRGDLVGPDLKDIAKRRSGSWLSDYLQSPSRMRAKKDPLTLEISRRYPGVKMPDLGLGPNDVQDVLAYIAQRSATANAVTSDNDGMAASGEAVP